MTTEDMTSATAAALVAEITEELERVQARSRVRTLDRSDAEDHVALLAIARSASRANPEVRVEVISRAEPVANSYRGRAESTTIWTTVVDGVPTRAVNRTHARRAPYSRGSAETILRVVAPVRQGFTAPDIRWRVAGGCARLDPARADAWDLWHGATAAVQDAYRQATGRDSATAAEIVLALAESREARTAWARVSS